MIVMLIDLEEYRYLSELYLCFSICIKRLLRKKKAEK